MTSTIETPKFFSFQYNKNKIKSTFVYCKFSNILELLHPWLLDVSFDALSLGIINQVTIK